MHYFDRTTPVILIHDEAGEEVVQADNHTPHGPFPLCIRSRPLDAYLLALWEGGMAASETSQRLVYHFQVLEYAAFYYLREETLRAARRIIAAPDIPSRLDEATRQIVDLVSDDRSSDEAKMVVVCQQVVDPAALWREIETNLPYFSEPVVFDGGYTMPALVNRSWKRADFQTAWIPKVPDAFRKLRNALVHAREQRLSKCIMPTRRNRALLRPWVSLSGTLAEQIITYGTL